MSGSFTNNAQPFDESAANLSSGMTLLTELLNEQQALTAVAEFSVQVERLRQTEQKDGYRALLPATPPTPGTQYAFEVDLDRCSGCKACVTACHALNGLDEKEAWRDVGVLIGGTADLPVLQHVTSACHHCLQPACMIACPVNAYEKDPVTGIVKHLDDQCFGCQYCTLACPYDVPKYHHKKGIVRKCDMCSTRLAVGEAPACVQSCPHQAISIKLVDTQQVIADAEGATFLPAAPDPQITYPTTAYKTAKPFPRNLLPADYFRVGRQPAHWPLVVMLVLTQLSVGAFAFSMYLDSVLDVSSVPAFRSLLAINALVFGILALLASVFHLGRPLYAFRAVLGLRHSWLSREIVAFGAFAGLALAYAVSTVWELPTQLPVSRWLGWSVVATGAVAVYCSAMIYVFPRRECWSFSRVAARFVLTAAWLGVAAVWLTILLIAISQPIPGLMDQVQRYGPMLCRLVILIATTKLLLEAARFRHLFSRRMTPLKRSALLMLDELSGIVLARFAVGLLGGIVMPVMLLVNIDSLVSRTRGPLEFLILVGILFAASLIGELLERTLFFAACATPRMPGGLR